MPPIPPLTWPHSPLTPVELPERVVEQVVGGARRARAGPDADHARRRNAPFMASDSNHSSSRSPTDMVITRNEVEHLAWVQPGRAAGLTQLGEQVAGPLGAERGRRA